MLAITGPTLPATQYGGRIPEVWLAVRLDPDKRRTQVIAWPSGEDQG